MSPKGAIYEINILSNINIGNLAMKKFVNF